MSCGGTPPITATWPDCRAPVRTLASGMILKHDLVEVGLTVVGPGLGRPGVARALVEDDLAVLACRVQRERAGADEAGRGPVVEREGQRARGDEAEARPSTSPAGTGRSARENVTVTVCGSTTVAPT